MAKDRDIRMMVVYGYSRLVGYDEQLQPRSRHPRARRERRQPRLHVAPASRPQVVGRPAVHDGGLPLFLGGCRQQSRPVAVRPAAGAEGSRPRPALRSAERHRGALHLGRAESAVPAGARRVRVPCTSTGRRITCASSTPSTSASTRRPRRPRKPAPAAGRATTRRRTSSSASTIPICRRSSRGSTRRRCRRRGSCSCAIRISIASTRRAGSFPTSTA